MRITPECFAHMAAFDEDDLPDGAWFALLTEGAELWINLGGDPQPWDAHDLVFAYIEAHPGYKRQ